MSFIKKKLLLSIYILPSLFICLNAFSQVAQKTIISGKITDELTGDPLPFVSVIIKGTTAGTISDAAGKFRFETSVRATELNFSFIGYQTETRTITPGKENNFNISSETLFNQTRRGSCNLREKSVQE